MLNWIDVLIVVLVAFSGMLGLVRGMVREVLGLVAWVGALAAAISLFPAAQGLARKSLGNPDLADPVAFGLLFLVVLIILSLLARTIGALIRSSVLGGLDRTLGLVFGLARGIVLMMGAYLVAGMLIPVEKWPELILEARSLPTIYLGAAWAAERIPSDYRPAVTPPPTTGRPTNAADLLHANPAGRASGPAPDAPAVSPAPTPTPAPVPTQVPAPQPAPVPPPPARPTPAPPTPAPPPRETPHAAPR